jgi:hypothetical protein
MAIPEDVMYESRRSQTSDIIHPHITPLTHAQDLTLILLRMAGMSDCVGQNLVQNGKGQTPAEGTAGSGQVKANPLLPTHEGIGCPQAGAGGGVDPERLSPPLLPRPSYLWVWPHLRVVVKGIK